MSDTSIWEAPAKLNLILEVRPRDANGLHPIRSLVQTIEWCDLVEMNPSDEDRLTIIGADLPDDGENIVWKAVEAFRKKVSRSEPRLAINLRKKIAVAAGLGGGSSDAAASLLAVAHIMHVSPTIANEVAPQVGADVPLFLQGGSLWMEGYGERLTDARINPAFAVAVAVPDFELRTADVYQAWDEMGSPVGPTVAGRRLPPGLRPFEPLRNDLLPAAIHTRPELGDWIEELSDRWERPVLMTGSGPGLFAFFADPDEAESAAKAVSSRARAARAAMPRQVGVRAIEEGDEDRAN